MVEIELNGLIYIFWDEMPLIDWLDAHADEVRAAYTDGYSTGMAQGMEKAMVHGQWILRNTCGPNTEKYHCSVCDKIPRSLCAENYCPNCGAKMDLEG